MEVYEALGLSEGEEKVYAALIKLKNSTTGPIYREANVSQSKVYEILERLKKKGLVASIVKEGITYWHPANPSIYLEKISRELEKLKKRKKILEKSLPSLLKQQDYPSDEAQVLVGYNGFRTALLSFLESFKPKDEFLVLGSPIKIPEPFYSFLKSYNKERVKKNVYAKFLYSESLRDFAEKLYDMPKTKVRYLKGLTPSSLAIGKDRIIIITWRDKGKCIVITGKEIALDYKMFFDSLWKMAKS